MRSDAEIIEAVLAGQREVFADLVHRYEGAVRAVALAISRNHHTAQDVTQDTFVAAFEKLAALRDRSAVGGWLLQIARHRALDAVKRASRTEPLDGREFADVSRNGQRTTNRANCSMRQCGCRSTNGRRADELLRGRKVADIAATTGRPLGTVTVQLTRAATVCASGEDRAMIETHSKQLRQLGRRFSRPRRLRTT